MDYAWLRYGGYEVSSKGDARFSAFNAKLEDGRSIEEHYQCDIKGYDVGGRNWRLGKGKGPMPMHDGRILTRDELWQAYLELWRQWAKGNRYLMRELRKYAESNRGILSDRFATTDINQARALSQILNEETQST